MTKYETAFQIFSLLKTFQHFDCLVFNVLMLKHFEDLAEEYEWEKKIGL